MKVKRIDPQYYDNTDFSDLMRRNRDTMIVNKVPMKRITLNIPLRIYQEASLLDQSVGSGYQNILKTAMAIGLMELGKRMEEKK